MLSKREHEICKIINKSKKDLTPKQIAEKLFKDDMHFEAPIKVCNSINRINRKFYEGKIKFKIRKLPLGKSFTVYIDS